MNRTETVAGGFFLAAWVVAGVYLAGWLEAPGWRMSLYGQYALAASWGWVVGNLYVLRRRSIPDAQGARKRLFLLLYLVVPAGVIVLVRSMLDPELRAAAPLADPLAVAIYALFFFVPFSLRRR